MPLMHWLFLGNQPAGAKMKKLAMILILLAFPANAQYKPTVEQINKMLAMIPFPDHHTPNWQRYETDIGNIFMVDMASVEHRPNGGRRVFMFAVNGDGQGGQYHNLHFDCQGHMDDMGAGGSGFHTIAPNTLWGAIGRAVCAPRVPPAAQQLAPQSTQQAIGMPTAPAQTRVGPSFDCASAGVANQPLAQIICSNDALARTDLSYVNVYLALRETLGEVGRGTLRQEANTFVEQVMAACGIPSSGWLKGRASNVLVNCITEQYTAQRSLLARRLSGGALEESYLTPDEAVELQKRLKVAGYLPDDAVIDGLLGPATRLAITKRQIFSDVKVTGYGSKAMLAQLSSMTGQLIQKPNSVTRERIAFGNHAGQSADIVSMEGVGTANATVQILLDWNRELQACSDEYLTYTPDRQDNDGYARCVSYAKQSFKGESVLTARANCQTGEMLGFGETKARYYVGQLKRAFREDGKSEESVYYTHVFHYEGFRIGDYSYTGVSVDGAVFRRLCPTSFTEPPKNDLSELVLRSDCEADLERAKRIATESGLRHVMNEKIIDAWDVQSEGTTWFEAKCSAKVAFNTGEKGTMEYKMVPEHGKYFIEVRIVP